MTPTLKALRAKKERKSKLGEFARETPMRPYGPEELLRQWKWDESRGLVEPLVVKLSGAPAWAAAKDLALEATERWPQASVLIASELPGGSAGVAMGLNDPRDMRSQTVPLERGPQSVPLVAMQTAIEQVRISCTPLDLNTSDFSGYSLVLWVEDAGDGVRDSMDVDLRGAKKRYVGDLWEGVPYYAAKKMGSVYVLPHATISEIADELPPPRFGPGCSSRSRVNWRGTYGAGGGSNQSSLPRGGSKR